MVGVPHTTMPLPRGMNGLAPNRARVCRLAVVTPMQNGATGCVHPIAAGGGGLVLGAAWAPLITNDAPSAVATINQGLPVI
jgi:hypothetical protein